MTLGAGASSANGGGSDAPTQALLALAATLADEARACRFLELTGLDNETLRARAGEPDVLIALIDFLAAHEPDLVAVAAAVGIEPGALAGLRANLGEEDSIE